MPGEVGQSGAFGSTEIVVDELADSYQDVDEDGDVRAKLWEGDSGTQKLFLRVRDHDDGRKYNEYTIDLDDAEGDGKVLCAECEENMVRPEDSDLSPPVCKTCRHDFSNRPVTGPRGGAHR